MNVIKILAAGPFTTVQDLGRFGYQRYGMAPAGAMDDISFQLGNHILGNSLDKAGLEFTLQGPNVEVLNDTVIAVTGGWCQMYVNGELQPLYAPIELVAGDQVSFSKMTKGVRGYLCVQGGIDVPQVMGSRSTYLRGQVGGFSGRHLKSGDVLSSALPEKPFQAPLPTEMWPDFASQISVDVVMGPQMDYFTEQGIETFLSKTYNISEAADRMGYRLSGPEIEHSSEADIISDGIPLGAIQVPGHRQPIIMMKDRQTTGGYPKIATVASYEIYKLGQAKPGDKIKFNKISINQARQKQGKIENWFKQLQRLVDQNIQSRKNLNVHVKNQFSKQVTIWELN